ncbi:MAG: RNA polymerase sigma factor [Phycisphaerae bacterium]
MDPRSDEQLLADHLAGVTGAFDCLVARYANELYGFLCRFVADNATAEDLIQETFVQVHLASSSFDPARTFRPWLYTIAANKARDHLRSRGRRQQYSLDSTGAGNDAQAPSQSLAAAETSLPEVVDAEERKAAVRELIKQMPEHLRLILTLGYYQQLPYAEIATILEIPVGTVKSRLHAAVNHFARLWRSHTEAGSTTEP